MQQGGYSSSSSNKPTPEEYLQLLAERNRLKKKLKEKTPEQQLIEEKEKGFSTHFRGANKVADGINPSEVQASNGAPNFGRISNSVLRKSPSSGSVAGKMRADKVRINRGTVSPASNSHSNIAPDTGSSGESNKRSSKKKSWGDSIPVTFPTEHEARVMGSNDGIASGEKPPSQIFFGKKVPIQVPRSLNAQFQVEQKRDPQREPEQVPREDSQQTQTQEEENDYDYADDFEVYYDANEDDAEGGGNCGLVGDADGVLNTSTMDETGNSDRELDEEDPDGCSQVIVSPVVLRPTKQQEQSTRKPHTNNLVEYYKERRRLQEEEATMLATKSAGSPKRGPTRSHIMNSTASRSPPNALSPSASTSATPKSPTSVKSPGRKQKKDKGAEYYASSADSFTASAANEIAAFVREFNSNMPTQRVISNEGFAPAATLVPVHIRIRILSNWCQDNNASTATTSARSAASLTVSLHKIELKHRPTNMNINISECKWQLFSGVLPVQASVASTSGASSAATAARSLHKLCKYEPTDSGNVPSLSLMPVPINTLGSNWKCTMEPDKSIEIVCIGDAIFPEGVPVPPVARNERVGGSGSASSTSDKDTETLYDDLALYLWNSSDPNAATKEVEVSIRHSGSSVNVLVWRGELPNPKRQGQFAIDEEKFTRFNLIQVIPLGGTVAVPGAPDGTTTVDSKANTVSRQLGNSIKLSLSGTSDIWGGTDSSTIVQSDTCKMTPIKETQVSVESGSATAGSSSLSSPSRKLNYQSTTSAAAATTDRPAWLGDVKISTSIGHSDGDYCVGQDANDGRSTLTEEAGNVKRGTLSVGSPIPNSFEAFKASRPSLTLKKRERKPRTTLGIFNAVHDNTAGAANDDGSAYTPSLDFSPKQSRDISTDHQSPNKASGVSAKNILKRRTSIASMLESDTGAAKHTHEHEHEQASREDAALRESLEALKNSNQFMNLSRLSLASDIVRRQGMDIDFAVPVVDANGQDSCASVVGAADVSFGGEEKKASAPVRVRRQMARTVQVAAAGTKTKTAVDTVPEDGSKAVLAATEISEQGSDQGSLAHVEYALLNHMVESNNGKGQADPSENNTCTGSRNGGSNEEKDQEMWVPTGVVVTAKSEKEPIPRVRVSMFEEEEELPGSLGVTDNAVSSIGTENDIVAAAKNSGGTGIAVDASPMSVASSPEAMKGSSPAATRPTRITLSKSKLSAVQESVSALLSNLSTVEIVKKNRKAGGTKGTSSASSLLPVHETESPLVQPHSEHVFPHAPRSSKPGLLTIYVLSNWGDLNYVGMNGLDLFDAEGRYIAMKSAAVISSPQDEELTRPAGGANGDEILQFEDMSESEPGSPSKQNRALHEFISKIQIESVDSNPTDVNILASNAAMVAVSSSISSLPAKDPRVISNILDQHNYTTSDLHVWLAPIGFYDPSVCMDTLPDEILQNEGSPPLAAISVQLKLPEINATDGDTKSCPLSTIRIWNYNKSRTHSNRGVKEVLITLDGRTLYRGDIAKAPGLLSSSCLLGAFSSNRGQYFALGESAGAESKQSQRKNEEYYYESISVGECGLELDSDRQHQVACTINRYDVHMGYATDTSGSSNTSMVAKAAGGPASGSVMHQLAVSAAGRGKWDASVGTASSFDLGAEYRPFISDVPISRPLTADSCDNDDCVPISGSKTSPTRAQVVTAVAELKAVYQSSSANEPIASEPSSSKHEPDGMKESETGFLTTREPSTKDRNEQIHYPNPRQDADADADADVDVDEYQNLMDEIRQLESDVEAQHPHQSVVAKAHAMTGLDLLDELRGEKSDGLSVQSVQPVDDISYSVLADRAHASADDAVHSDASSLYGLNADQDLVFCQYITLLMEDSWGDEEYIGLAGVEVLQGVWCLPVDMSASPHFPRITAEPRDLTSVGMFDDPRVPENLLVSSDRQRTRLGKKAYNYNTTLDKNMWLVPFTPSTAKTQSTSSSVAVHHITFNLGQVTGVSGLRVWNYNKAFEGTNRGVKFAQIYTYIGTGGREPVIPRYLGRVLLRRGPGCDGVKFEQLVLLRDVIADHAANASTDSNTATPGARTPFSLTYITPPIRQDYQVNFFGPSVNTANARGPNKGSTNKDHAVQSTSAVGATSMAGCPTSGMLWKFTLLNNHGDEYYIGLDAMEFFDENGHLVAFSNGENSSSSGVAQSSRRSRVFAVPHSVADVQSVNLQETCDGDDDADAELGRDRRGPRSLFHYQQKDDADSGVDVAGMSKPWSHHLPLPGPSPQHGHGWLTALSKSMTESERLVACKRVSSADSFPDKGPTSHPQQFNFYQNNTLFVLFDRPVTVSLLRLYNYSKTPARGVNEFMLEVDSKLVYVGGIPAFDPTLDNSINGYRKPSQSVVFTSNSKVLATEKPDVRKNE